MAKFPRSVVRITGLGTNPPPAGSFANLAMKDGYAICDTLNSMLFLYTVRPSRAQSWDQFCKKGTREKYKRQGFRCVPVMVKEYKR